VVPDGVSEWASAAANVEHQLEIASRADVIVKRRNTSESGIVGDRNGLGKSRRLLTLPRFVAAVLVMLSGDQRAPLRVMSP